MRKTLSMAILLSFVVVSTALARNLEDLAKEAGADWLAGTWEAQSDSGNKTTVTYDWALAKHVVMVDFRSSRRNSKGMVFYDAADDQVVYVAADDQGGSDRGIWTLKDGNPVIVYEYTDAQGEKRRAGVLHRRQGDDAFVGEVYSVLDSGDIAAEPTYTMQFRRKK